MTRFDLHEEVTKKPVLSVALVASTVSTGSQDEKTLRIFEACRTFACSDTRMYSLSENVSGLSANMVSLYSTTSWTRYTKYGGS